MKFMFLILAVILFTQAFVAQSFTLALDGTYVGGDRAVLAPDGTYVGGSNPNLTPDGNYVGSGR